jgi:hypothetical protein
VLFRSDGIAYRVVGGARSGAPFASFGTATRNNGTLTISHTYSTPSGANQSGSGTGTSSLASDGSLTDAMSDLVFNGAAGAAGTRYVSAAVSTTSDQLMVVGLKTSAEATYSNASLRGTYGRVRINSSPNSSLAWITFDGRGRYSLTQISSSPSGASQSGTSSGSYSANADGTYTIEMGGGRTGRGFLAPDGSAFVVAGVGDTTQQALAVGLRLR